MKCCICGKEIEGYGNNPWPVLKDKDGNGFVQEFVESDEYRCCDECNIEYVIPARIERLIQRNRG